MDKSKATRAKAGLWPPKPRLPITAVYFANPYGNAANQDDVCCGSESLTDYKKHCDALQQWLKGRNASNCNSKTRMATVIMKDGKVAEE